MGDYLHFYAFQDLDHEMLSAVLLCTNSVICLNLNSSSYIIFVMRVTLLLFMGVVFMLHMSRFNSLPN